MNSLREKITGEIRARGPIPFSRYMELCLYDPEFGYYSRNAEQFGKAGDFYTSSDIHAVFGRLMARQFDEMWRLLGSPPRITIKELGPGRGLFAQDVLDWSEKRFPDFFRATHYVLIEQSPALHQRIESTLKSRLETGKAELLREDQRVSGPVIIFANELFDALPVEIVSDRGSLRIDVQDLDSRVAKLAETWVTPSAEELEFLDQYSVHPDPGERLEVQLEAQRCLARAGDFDRGFLIVIDYGYTRAEQLAGRHHGTLKAIRQHAVSANPYEAPGQQDITADVNFTALAALAEASGLHAEKLVTQSQFLMGIGEANQFADAFEDCRLPQERTKVALQLKHLVTPAGMGESFHVLVASKGIETRKAASLTGLRFGKK